MADYTLSAKITADNKDFDSEMKGTNNILNDTEEKTSGFPNTLKKIAKVAGTAFAVDKIKDFGIQIVNNTSELNAMDAQFEQIFKGKQGEEALKKISTASKDLKVHGDRLTGTFNKFGAQTKGAGMDGKKALEATDKATRLAADAAAFYDVSLEDAAQSVSSFMKGNFEAGDAIGVFTNAKQMDVKSNKEYGKSWKDLTEDERQYLLLDTVGKTYEMNGAMGQAKRESGEYANVMGNLKATWGEFLQVIGQPILKGTIAVMQGLIAVIMSIIGFINNFTFSWGSLSGVVAKVKDVISNGAGIIKDAMIGMVEGAKPLIEQLKQVWIDFKPVLQVVASLVGGALALAFGVAIGIIKGVISAIVPLTSAFLNLVSFISNTVMVIVSLFKGDFAGAWDYVLLAGQNAIDFFINGLKAIWNYVSGFVTGVIDFFKHLYMVLVGGSIVPDMVNAIIDWFKNLFTSAINLVKTLVTGVINFFKNLFNSAKEIFSNIKTTVINVLNNLKDGAINIWNNIKNAITIVMNNIKTVVGSIWNAIKNVISIVWNGIKSAINTAINIIKTIITTYFNIIKTIITTVWNGIKTITSTVWNGIKTAISNVINSIKTIISTIINVIRNIISTGWNFIRSISSSVWGGIRSLISSILNSIKSKFTSIFNAFRNIVSTAFRNVKSAVSSGMKNALSKVTGFFSKFRDAGKNIVGSIADGIKGAVSKVKNAIGGVTSKIRDFLPFSPAKEGPLKDLNKLNFGGTISYGIEKGKRDVRSSMHHLLDFANPNNLVERTNKSIDYSDTEKGTTNQTVIFRLGNKSYKGFVNGITGEQQKEIELEEIYGL